MARMRSMIAGVVLVPLVLACSDSLGPASELELFVRAAPDRVFLGDTVTLTGVSFNGSNETIPAGWGCSHGIGFFVTDESGVEADLYEGLAFICPLRDDNELEPGETDVVEWRWVPPAIGIYQVRSAALLGEGRTVRSRPAEVTVVAPPSN